ncbi:site-specific DNA-methyltransferase [Corynebacterium pyruviciproducens]|uniref:site-specific DNA-methyltransferase n=1 Tax=Corynebacterium pyruviciproducens TaxID=598660 RepID=UPI00254A027B|nr:site-specific DNA-methyltransferase [Corynebacterium pyruviciproducens]MDK6567126.1 site-specific DNA-methyltransferase [Corynebacterium pyruviciproducens]
MSKDVDSIKKVAGASPDFRTKLAEQLAELTPEAIADGKIDVEKLKELLDGDASDTSERFGLFWPGKKRAIRAAQTPTTATLRPDKENSKDWDTTKNVFIEGDNLEVLKILQKHYYGKIKMIYIDPPYNTGKDFVYHDNFKDGIDTYLEWSKQVNEEGKKLSSNTETDGRYHSNWLNMMYPRLKLARNLLTDSGVIFISIGDAEVDNLKKQCNEIFGESNFIAQIIWKSKSGGSADERFIVTENEYILAYARRIQSLRLNQIPQDTSKYNRKDEYFSDRGGYVLKKLDFRMTLSHYTESLNFPIILPDGNEIWPGGKSTRSDGGWNWRWSRDKVEWGIEHGYIEFTQRNGKWTVNSKQYARVDNEGNPIVRTTPFRSSIDEQSIKTTTASRWIVDKFGAKVFEYSKPVELLEKLIKLGTEKDSLILDFFSGSSTTAHAVMKVNQYDCGSRQHIQVQLPEPTEKESEAYKAGFENISEIARKRIILAGEALTEAGRSNGADETFDKKLDIGFRCYKLSDTNFTKWRAESDTDATQLEQHLFKLRESANDDATPDDLLTEILIKQGHSLVEQIRDCEIDGLAYKAVVRVDDESGEEDTLVLAYLDEHTKPTLAQLRAGAEVKPAQFIILEDALKGNDELKTNLAQICKTNGTELWTA